MRCNRDDDNLLGVVGQHVNQIISFYLIVFSVHMENCKRKTTKKVEC